ncbi:hypothetical protein D9K22_10345 [Escherichia coli]|nr:hypothetical protein [Escherichia coli]
MLSQIQRFGGAMFTPVLLFPFAGIVVGLAILLQNPMFVGDGTSRETGFRCLPRHYGGRKFSGGQAGN